MRKGNSINLRIDAFSSSCSQSEELSSSWSEDRGQSNQKPHPAPLYMPTGLYPSAPAATAYPFWQYPGAYPMPAWPPVAVPVNSKWERRKKVKKKKKKRMKKKNICIPRQKNDPKLNVYGLKFAAARKIQRWYLKAKSRAKTRHDVFRHVKFEDYNLLRGAADG